MADKEQFIETGPMRMILYTSICKPYQKLGLNIRALIHRTIHVLTAFDFLRSTQE